MGICSNIIYSLELTWGKLSHFNYEFENNLKKCSYFNLLVWKCDVPIFITSLGITRKYSHFSYKFGNKHGNTFPFKLQVWE